MVFIINCITNFYAYSNQGQNPSVSSTMYDSTLTNHQVNDVNQYNFPKFGIHLGFEILTHLYVGINFRLTDDTYIDFGYLPEELGLELGNGPYTVYNLGLSWKYDENSMGLIRINLPFRSSGEKSIRYYLTDKFSPSISYVRSIFIFNTSHLKIIFGLSSIFQNEKEKGWVHDKFLLNLGIQFCIGFGK